MTAIDDGTNSGYSDESAKAFPVFHAGAFDQQGSVKGGPYSHGAFPGGGQFGLMFVDDQGDQITIRWSGRNWQDEEFVSFTFSVPGG
jgi:hypothetical protein